jgi:stage IV sporulation protein FA
MDNNRANEIKRRIAKRKRDRHKSNPPLKDSSAFLVKDEEKYGFERFSSYEGGSNDPIHPLFRKEVFMFKVLFSVCLILVVAILFKNPSLQFEPARKFVTHTMENDFQFAAVSTWYEEQFGNPLALLPTKKEDIPKDVADKTEYAMPAAGKVLESFDVNGQGIMVETGSKSSVEAMNEGNVIFAGNKDQLGKTVIIQHADGSETWYGNLQSVSITLYKFVEKGEEIGKVTDSEDNEKGMFYFAIKQGETFIDPIQVIKFE